MHCLSRFKQFLSAVVLLLSLHLVRDHLQHSFEPLLGDFPAAVGDVPTGLKIQQVSFTVPITHGLNQSPRLGQISLRLFPVSHVRVESRNRA